MSDPIDPPQSSARPAVATLRCFRCRYDLSATAPDANCPECGLSVWTSGEGYKLRHAPPPYVKAVRKGLAWLQAGLVLMAITATVSALTLIVLRNTSIDLAEYFGEHVAFIALFLYVPYLAARVITAAGLSSMSAREKGDPEKSWTRHRALPVPPMRIVARSAVIVFAAAVAVRIAMDSMVIMRIGELGLFDDSGEPSWLYRVLMVALPMSVLATWVMLATGLLLAARLAERIPADRLAVWLRRMVWIIPALLISVFAVNVLVPAVVVTILLQAANIAIPIVLLVPIRQLHSGLKSI